MIQRSTNYTFTTLFNDLTHKHPGVNEVYDRVFLLYKIHLNHMKALLQYVLLLVVIL